MTQAKTAHSMEGCALLPRLQVLLRRHVRHTNALTGARTLLWVMTQLRHRQDLLVEAFHRQDPSRFERSQPPL